MCVRDNHPTEGKRKRGERGGDTMAPLVPNEGRQILRGEWVGGGEGGKALDLATIISRKGGGGGKGSREGGAI